MATASNPTQTILQMGELFRKKIEPTRRFVAEETTISGPLDAGGLYVRESRVTQCITLIFGLLIFVTIFMTYLTTGLPLDFVSLLTGQTKFSEKLTELDLDTSQGTTTSSF